MQQNCCFSGEKSPCLLDFFFLHSLHKVWTDEPSVFRGAGKHKLVFRNWTRTNKTKSDVCVCTFSLKNTNCGCVHPKFQGLLLPQTQWIIHGCFDCWMINHCATMRLLNGFTFFSHIAENYTLILKAHSWHIYISWTSLLPITIAAFFLFSSPLVAAYSTPSIQYILQVFSYSENHRCCKNIFIHFNLILWHAISVCIGMSTHSRPV